MRRQVGATRIPGADTIQTVNKELADFHLVASSERCYYNFELAFTSSPGIFQLFIKWLLANLEYHSIMIFAIKLLEREYLLCLRIPI